MTTIASQITNLAVVYSTVYSDVDQRKHQSSASLAFVRGIHRDRWIPRTKGQLRGNASIWWRHHDRGISVKDMDTFVGYFLRNWPWGGRGGYEYIWSIRGDRTVYMTRYFHYFFDWVLFTTNQQLLDEIFPLFLWLSFVHNQSTVTSISFGYFA